MEEDEARRSRAPFGRAPLRFSPWRSQRIQGVQKPEKERIFYVCRKKDPQTHRHRHAQRRRLPADVHRVPHPGADPLLREDGHLRPAGAAGRIFPGTGLRRGRDLLQKPALRPDPRHLFRLRGRDVQLYLRGRVLLHGGLHLSALPQPQVPEGRPCGLYRGRRADGRGLPAPELLCGLSRLCGALSDASRGHRGDVPGHPARGGQPVEVPADLQRALHLLQGPHRSCPCRR